MKIFNAKAQRHDANKPRLGLRREAKRHAALEWQAAFKFESPQRMRKRCRRCALPPRSKIFESSRLCAFALKIKMPWIIKNLWLIPALPILAAGLSALAQSAGTECRQKVAHGVSCGYRVGNIPSPGGAKDSSGMFFTFVRRALFDGPFLSPLRGWVGFDRIPHGARRGLPSGIALELSREQFAEIIPSVSQSKGLK